MKRVPIRPLITNNTKWKQAETVCLPCVPIRASKRGQRKIARFLFFFKTAPLITLISFFSGSGSHYPGSFFFLFKKLPNTVHRQLCWHCFCGLPSSLWGSGRLFSCSVKWPLQGVKSFQGCLCRLTWRPHVWLIHLSQMFYVHDTLKQKQRHKKPALRVLYVCLFCRRGQTLISPGRMTALSVHTSAVKAAGRCWCLNEKIDTPQANFRGQTVRHTKHRGSHKHMHTVGRSGENSSLEDRRLQPAILMQPDPCPDVGSLCRCIDPVISKPF